MGGGSEGGCNGGGRSDKSDEGCEGGEGCDGGESGVGGADGGAHLNHAVLVHGPVTGYPGFLAQSRSRWLAGLKEKKESHVAPAKWVSLRDRQPLPVT